ncbi:MAG: hypothetical protein K6G22_02675 [Lachnospiraceae bacterium]|nr:hypothetical protein [Lachnospiraceae bacterium]
MNNKSQTKTKVLIFLPIIIFAIAVICLSPMIINYFKTGSDVTAVAIIFIGSLSMILIPVPCLVMSILGTVFASREKNEGIEQSRKLYMIGIIEIIVYAIGVIGTFFAIVFSVIAAGRW